MKTLFKIKTFVILVICIVFAEKSNAQSQDKDTTKSYFKASLSYLSDAVYNGRKDSTTYPYITPRFGYYDKSGFFVDGSLSYLAAAGEKRIDLFTLEVGYDFNITKKLSGGIYADKYFYNTASTNVQSDIKGIAGAYFNYDFDVLQLSAGTGVVFATKKDFSLNASIGHAFTFGDDGNQWTINPTASMNASTLNFYEGYTDRRSGKNAEKNGANAGTVASVTTIYNRGNGLTLLDYELALPISYDAAKWGISLTPTLALPQNPIYTRTTTTYKSRIGSSTISQTVDSTPQSERALGTPFFTELSVYFKF